MPKPQKYDAQWHAIMDGNRTGVMRVIDSIRKGEVDEIELEKLNNFVQFSLALMEICGSEKWARAKMNAEMMHYLKEKNP